MADRDDNDNVYPFRPNIDRPKIDVNNQLAARRAIQSILRSQRVAISSRHFHGGQTTIRVLIDGEYYDVDAFRLEQLQSGIPPAALYLAPVRDEDFRFVGLASRPAQSRPASIGYPWMIVSDNELTSNAILTWQEDRHVEWHYIAPGKLGRALPGITILDRIPRGYLSSA